MRSGQGKADGGGGWDQPESELRLLAETATQATDDMIAALHDAGLTSSVLRSPEYTLRALNRGLPNVSLEDLLLTCEAFTSVTVPSALATGDLGRIQSEAHRTYQLLQALASGVRGRRRLTFAASAVTEGMQLRAALSEPAVRSALAQLIEILAALAALDGGNQRKRRAILPIGVGCLVPGTVLGSAVVLIVFLLTTIAFATGQVAITGTGVIFPSTSGKPTATTSATATTQAAGPAATPTHMPRLKPTATSQPAHSATSTPSSASAPAWSVSQLNQPPCSTAQFTITYTSGSSPISWTASWSDQTGVQVSPASGTLQPGGTVTVNVTAQIDLTNQITVAANNGLPAQSVSYDSTSC